MLLDPSPTTLDGYFADPLDHSDDGTQVDTSCQMSESFSQGCPAKSGEKSCCCYTTVKLRQNNRPTVLCLRLLPPPSRRGTAAVMEDCIRSPLCSPAMSSASGDAWEEHWRGLRQLQQQGKLVSGVSCKIGVAVCRPGKQLAKLGRSSSSCRDAVFVQWVGTPLSRKQRRTMYL